jgi:excisionase family DNA binding protein
MHHPTYVQDASAPALNAAERAQAVATGLVADLSELRHLVRRLADELTSCSQASESPPVLLTIAEAGRSLRIGRTVVWQLIKDGDLRSVKIGASRRVPVEALTEYAASLRAS